MPDAVLRVLVILHGMARSILGFHARRDDPSVEFSARDVFPD
jgi:hypothetical protein